MFEKIIGLIVLINFLAVAIVVLKMLVKERRKSKVEANKLADEFARFFDKHPECKNLREVNEKLRNQEYRSPPNYGEYKTFCEQLKKRNESIKENMKLKIAVISNNEVNFNYWLKNYAQDVNEYICVIDIHKIHGQSDFHKIEYSNYFEKNPNWLELTNYLRMRLK